VTEALFPLSVRVFPTIDHNGSEVRTESIVSFCWDVPGGPDGHGRATVVCRSDTVNELSPTVTLAPLA
jgi:hypothetical protein